MGYWDLRKLPSPLQNERGRLFLLILTTQCIRKVLGRDGSKYHVSPGPQIRHAHDLGMLRSIEVGWEQQLVLEPRLTPWTW